MHYSSIVKTFLQTIFISSVAEPLQRSWLVNMQAGLAQLRYLCNTIEQGVKDVCYCSVVLLNCSNYGQYNKKQEIKANINVYLSKLSLKTNPVTEDQSLSHYRLD